ncbi:MAG: hypothetical protein KBC12_01170 [Candidatus Pacebacteria bacterium]|jgi:hypothetical protein|nr:hypothetical protein [Candidatus Paceibacterota bacterium]MBP9851542.1 hypothetical protein [Candidatus Paceibacterota bacterium]
MAKQKETVSTPSFDDFCKEKGVDFLSPQELIRLPLVVQIAEMEFTAEMRERYNKEVTNSQQNK